MANASKKHFGPGVQGKGDGGGGLSEARTDKIEPNKVLSNRDKSRHPASRGQDSKWIQTEQLEDSATNKRS